MNTSIRKPALVLIVVVMSLLSSLIGTARAADDGPWVGTWAASPQPLWPAGLPLATGVPDTLRDQTIRQVVRVGIGGTRVRVVLSNEYGERPLVIGAAHVALTASSSGTTLGTDRALTFAGSRGVTVPPGAPMLSDPIDFALPAFAQLSVSLHLPQPTAPSTFHWDGLQTAYVIDGDATAATSPAVTQTLQSRLFLRGVEVTAPAATRSVVTFGDSITDGAASTPGTDRRWPDALARRLAPHGITVLNAGISGARVLSDRMGSNGLARFDRDVLAPPRIDAVIVLVGINDIGWPGTPFAKDDPPMTADTLVAGYAQLVARARANGVRIVGATLPPFEGALTGSPITGYYTPEKDAVRQQVNAWIRAPGHFDALIDLDALLRGPAHPTRMKKEYDSGDHLHPGDRRVDRSGAAARGALTPRCHAPRHARASPSSPRDRS